MSKGRKVKFADSLFVLRTIDNPKKPNSKAKARFDKYPKRTMVTVGEVLKIEGGPNRADLDFDKKHGYIFIGTKDELTKLANPEK